MLDEPIIEIMNRRTMYRRLLGPVCAVILLAPIAIAQAQVAFVQAAYAGVDPQLGDIDIYLTVGGVAAGKLEDINAGGDATPFTPIIANVTVQAGVAPGSSASQREVIKTFPLTFEANSANIIVLSGVVDPGAFAPNADERDISLQLFDFDMARQLSSSDEAFDVLLFHGSTDTPAVDIVLRNESTLVSGLSYGEFSSYRPVRPGTYTVDVVATQSGSVVASFLADLSTGFAGTAAVVGLLGFAEPERNQDGEPLTMVVLFPTGGSSVLPAAEPATDTAIEIVRTFDPSTVRIDPSYPNPFRSSTRVTYALRQRSFVTLEVFDLLGRLVGVVVDEWQSAGEHVADVRLDGWPAGAYVYSIRVGDYSESRTVAFRP